MTVDACIPPSWTHRRRYPAVEYTPSTSSFVRIYGMVRGPGRVNSTRTASLQEMSFLMMRSGHSDVIQVYLCLCLYSLFPCLLLLFWNVLLNAPEFHRETSSRQNTRLITASINVDFKSHLPTNKQRLQISDLTTTATNNKHQLTQTSTNLITTKNFIQPTNQPTQLL